MEVLIQEVNEISVTYYIILYNFYIYMANHGNY